VISVVSPGSGDHPFSRPLEDAGVPVHQLEVPAKAFLKERRGVRALLREIRPDVVHTHGYRPVILNGPVARRLGIPTVATEHGSSKLGGATTAYEHAQDWMFRRCDAVVAVSSPIVQRLRGTGVPEERIRLIPNGWIGNVDFLPRDQARRELGLPAEGVLLAFVGRLIEAKGPDVFAAACVAMNENTARCVIIGDGRQREEVENILEAGGSASEVHMLGELSNAAPYFKAFDGFVLSSRTEGTPIVLFEAIAAQVPIVATRVGGVPDVLTAEEAILVLSENPEALADAMNTLVTDRAGAEQRAVRATQRLEDEFGAQKWLERHEEVYRAVVDARRGAPET
jgi:glycosyltransferase involved in cell wall biosynthesis